MPPESRRGAWFTVLCVLLLGVFLVRNGVGEPTGGPPQPGRVAGSARYGPAAKPPAASTPLPHAVPRRIVVASVGIDAPLVAVGLDADGWVAAPYARHANLAGWYSGAVVPGERGTAVVVGHVDTDAGPAVFYPLGSLPRGARVEVARADGRTAVFSVYAVEVFPRKAFPAARVYADGANAELRLLTCGGEYSDSGGYEGNVVVFARLVDVR